ncbi:3-ketoacyl-CoA synthase 17-like [Phalaenopsis equestris]|uniref:3-ketoacyl-CoA synthase 17-like n=1 Tax=Phalaenopsis equestris TaxID=78828 RepID=UPI0009E325BB|nr:3-ketoacyl-CoA synthase 17-like [Phalaenopsis equestris]
MHHFNKSSSINLVASLTLTIVLTSHRPLLLLLLLLLFCSIVASAAYLSSRPFPVFFLNYSCHQPDPEYRCTYELCEYIGMSSRQYSDESAKFMRAIYRKSGLGDETYAPPYVFQRDFNAKFKYAIIEADDGMFSVVSSLLFKLSVPTEKISVVIVACSMFSPAPSLASRLVNRFGFRSDVKTFNLSGMGCSAGAVGMDLAVRILKRSQGYALLVVTEATGLSWYYGDNRQMLVTNCIFRVGAAATLLTSDPAARHAAKFELLHNLRTHHGAEDAAYYAAFQAEDPNGSIGVSLTKDLIRVAGVALRDHISILAPRVLPITELLRYAWRVAISVAKGESAKSDVPDFTTAFEHMCIHTGGKAVIDAVGRNMGLDDRIIEAARMCLHRFGNTSSCLVFYELGYFEAKGRVRRGDRVWMLAFGTGFKACSVVWRALRDGNMEPDCPWRDCIHRYPVKLDFAIK